MPKLNQVWLDGIVAYPPSYKVDENENLCKAALELLLIHDRNRIGMYEQNAAQPIPNYNRVVVQTSNPQWMELICRCQLYDAVFIKGFVQVHHLKKKGCCPQCNEAVIYPCTKTTVYPIFMEKRENLLMPLGIFDPNQPPKTPAQKQQRWEMSQQYLLPRIEVSNQVTLLGAIAQAPTAYLRETDSMEMLSFCLAVKRAFFVADSVASDNVDFVYCKLYGDAAVKYKNVLSKGNLILVSGALQTRRITQKIRCTTCQSKFPVNSTVTEVLPFNIELLRQTLGQDTFKVQPQDMLPYRIGSEADTYLIQPMLREADVDAQTATSPNPQIVDPAILDEIRKEKKTW